jgi:TRAP-type C4-dicarboxylate transport system permease small subunit
MRKMGAVPIFLSRLCGWAAAAFLAAMVLLSVADVLLRTFFNYPIRGMLELIELGLACTIFIALPAVFLRDEHLRVDVIDHLTRPGVVRVLHLSGMIVSLVVLAVMAWNMAHDARNMYQFGDVTSDLSIPKLWYWAPVLFGVVASAAACLFFIFRWRRRP